MMKLMMTWDERKETGHRNQSLKHWHDLHPEVCTCCTFRIHSWVGLALYSDNDHTSSAEQQGHHQHHNHHHTWGVQGVGADGTDHNRILTGNNAIECAIPPPPESTNPEPGEWFFLGGEGAILTLLKGTYPFLGQNSPSCVLERKAENAKIHPRTALTNGAFARSVLGKRRGKRPKVQSAAKSVAVFCLRGIDAVTDLADPRPC